MLSGTVARQRGFDHYFELLVRQLDRPLSGWIDDAAPQRGVTTYADKIDPAELEIDWARTPEEIDRLIRIGGAWTTFRDARLKVHAAELVDGVVRPVTVQPAGKSPMAFDAWRNGAQPRPDELFG